jgi:GNAT superfamily N-acetyltransferase
MSTRIIFDTNIIISLEENAPVADPVAQLFALLQTNAVHVLVHPASIQDIQNDRDESRRTIKLSKLKKYGQLAAAPELDGPLFANAGIHIGGDNDVIDCTILTALAKDAAHFLVTEDRRLLGKARALGLGDRVLTIEQALSLFNAVYAKQPIELPNLELIHLHQIRDELRDEIFDSLRSDYPGFDSWFVRSCQEGRQAWIARDPLGKLGAICIYKEEESAQVTSSCRLDGRVLKMSTLKVEKNVRGQKIGELLLKAAFRHASQNDYERIYVTVKEKQSELIDLLNDFGFQSVGKDHNDDLVFVKDQPKQPPSTRLDAVAYHVRYSPHFKGGAHVGKFVIPIRPEYHRQLFPDASDRQLRLPFAGALPGNAIKLAYLCKAKTNEINPGDVLIFYRSQDTQNCTTIGIVESIDRLDDADMILERVLKRTVYTRTEIEEICDGGCLVVLFRLQGHLPKPVEMSILEQNGIKGPIQTIRKITDEQFRSIAKLGQIESCISSD